MDKLSLSDFDYHLPESLIAQQPADPRDHSRLLVYDRATGRIIDTWFYQLHHYLPEHTVLVINNSRVVKARLLFGKKEVFVTRTVDPFTVEAMVRPGKSFKKGQALQLVPEPPSAPKSAESIFDNTRPENIGKKDANSLLIFAEVLNVNEEGIRTLRFNHPVDSPIFQHYRHTPFPPYIRPDEKLADRYQTVYAQNDGSIAAPTAGLHFTDRVFYNLDRKSIRKVELTLHIGPGTFAPVKTERIEEHNMHSEWYQITPDTVNKLRTAQHITAVGTTSARVLESAIRHSGNRSTGSPPPPLHSDTDMHPIPAYRDFKTGNGETHIFIKPGYHFQAVDALITNFHLPKSTLLMMISAFVGLEEMHRIYSHAIREQYRFYSFGDAMLLL